MVSSRNVVAVACAFHEILIDHFPRPPADADGREKQIPYDTARLEKFFDVLKLMTELAGWRDMSKESKETVTEILNSVAVHRKHNCLQLGGARTAFARIYAGDASLAGILSNGRIGPDFDFASNVRVADPGDLERWVKIRGKVLNSWK